MPSGPHPHSRPQVDKTLQDSKAANPGYQQVLNSAVSIPRPNIAEQVLTIPPGTDTSQVRVTVTGTVEQLGGSGTRGGLTGVGAAVSTVATLDFSDPDKLSAARTNLQSTMAAEMTKKAVEQQAGLSRIDPPLSISGP